MSLIPEAQRTALFRSEEVIQKANQLGLESSIIAAITTELDPEKAVVGPSIEAQQLLAPALVALLNEEHNSDGQATVSENAVPNFGYMNGIFFVWLN